MHWASISLYSTVNKPSTQQVQMLFSRADWIEIRSEMKQENGWAHRPTVHSLHAKIGWKLRISCTPCLCASSVSINFIQCFAFKILVIHFPLQGHPLGTFILMLRYFVTLQGIWFLTISEGEYRSTLSVELSNYSFSYCRSYFHSKKSEKKNSFGFKAAYISRTSRLNFNFCICRLCKVNIWEPERK
jgi:hypothetical protein